MLCPHDLVFSQIRHLQIPSHWGLGSTFEFDGGDTTIQSKVRPSSNTTLHPNSVHKTQASFLPGTSSPGRMHSQLHVSLALVHPPLSLTGRPPSCYLTPPPPLLHESNSSYHETQAPDFLSEISLYFQPMTPNKQLHWTLSSAAHVLVSQTLDAPQKQISVLIHFLWTP